MLLTEQPMHNSSFGKLLDKAAVRLRMVVHNFATVLGECLVILVIQLLKFQHCYSYLKSRQTAYTNSTISNRSSISEKEEWLITKRSVNELVTTLEYLCKTDDFDELSSRFIVELVKEYMSLIPRKHKRKSAKCFENFRCVPWDLVKLLESPVESRRAAGAESIQVFLYPNIECLPPSIRNQCFHIVKVLCLRLCQLEDLGNRHPLYDSCRETFGSMIESIGYRSRARYSIIGMPCDVIFYLHMIVENLSDKVCQGLDYFVNESSFDAELPSCFTLSFENDIRDFVRFSLHLRKAIEYHVRWKEACLKQRCRCFGYNSYRYVFVCLSHKMDDCLTKLYRSIMRRELNWRIYNPRWSYYFSIAKEMHNIYKLYRDDEKFSVLRDIFRQDYAVATLIMISDRSGESDQWLLEYKNSMHFDFRKKFVRKLFQRVDEYNTDGTRQKILIDRSKLLTSSFEEFACMNPKWYYDGIDVEFKEEMATGPGVFREWIFLVCQALFDLENSLFLACPGDRRRFFPNPAAMDTRQLDYFTFCGRMVGLALTYKVQVGIAFDSVFFKQLSGEVISLEDVCHADPFLYSSCKKILEMDAAFVDSDAMALTFAKEIEEFGTKKTVELCHGGNSIAVNSDNREEYVNLLIHHSYVKPTSEKVALFARGFGEILCEQSLQRVFFRCLELKDLDLMLCGSDQALSVQEWKAHTDYSGYKQSDKQICWFWKVVSGMTMKQQRQLLFFWTSVKYLPAKGFSSLPSRLCIDKTSASYHHLPSSHTCFYQLVLPQYPSLAVMKKKLLVVCQEHACSSFGSL